MHHIHHIDGNPYNNSPKNLMLADNNGRSMKPVKENAHAKRIRKAMEVAKEASNAAYDGWLSGEVENEDFMAAHTAYKMLMRQYLDIVRHATLSVA